MDVIDELPPGALAHDDREKKASAIKALLQLVEGPGPIGKLPVISDAAAWVHTAFYTYRSAMADNDPALPQLFNRRIEFCLQAQAVHKPLGGIVA